MTNRRDFLAQGSVLVLGGGVFVEAADEVRQPVRVAVVGTGSRGSDLIRALTTIERARIVAICDDYAPHLAQGRRYAGARTRGHADFARMLREETPRAVVIAVPLHLHFDLCRLALEAGCDVFCEKMMCYSLDQARTLAGLVARHGAVFQVGLQRRANAIYRQAVAMVETGMLGKIVAIKCQWHRHDNWRRPVPLRRGQEGFAELEARLNWRLYGRFSQGLPAELGSHQIDIATWILGRNPSRVLASGGIDHWRDGREICDNVFCIYEYEVPGERGRPGAASPAGGTYTVRVTFSSLQNNAYEGASELILGTRGTLFLTPGKGLFYREATAAPARAPGSAEGEAALVTSGRTLRITNDPWAHRGRPYEMDAEGDETRDALVGFLDCVQRRDSATMCDARVGIANTATILMANQAIQERRSVSWPL